MEFPVPENEEERLNALRGYDSLNSHSEKAFDRVTSIASKLLNVPIALVSLIDKDRQFIKSCYGISIEETPREDAFCAYTILSRTEPLIVEDATKDPRFCDNPGVTGDPGIRFYVGVPITVRNQFALGSLCVVDKVPRTIEQDQIDVLIDLAKIVERELMLHEKRHSAETSEKMLQEHYAVVQDVLEHLRKNLTRTISHELRTPLSGLVGLADILTSDWQTLDPQEIQEILDHLSVSSKRIERIVENVCLLADLEIISTDESAKSQLVNGFPVDLENLVDRVANSIARSYERACDLEISMEPFKAELPEQFAEKVVSELIDNAFKFSEQGDPVTVNSRRNGAEIILEISDRGRGMSPTQLKQIGAFMQFDRNKHEQQGLGAGLGIVQKIANEFALAFRVKSEQSLGTSIELSIPSHGH